MRRPTAALALALAAAADLAAPPPPASAAPAVVPIEVRAEPGAAASAARELRAGGLRVHRRRGGRLQVAAAPIRAAAIARLPSVRGARPANGAFGDDVIVSEGFERTGANVLARVADEGRGLVIAVLDLGFGRRIGELQALGELPPPALLELASFDPVWGIQGRNAYGNLTNHGELVAQTVFDYAPRARYLFVSYHTEADFQAAVDFLVARRPDIVVHSNNFLTGPFDGTGPLARAVDRAAAAGILWFNSTGNYAQRHWTGEWSDADGDGDLDWPNGDAWTFARGIGLPITFAVSWRRQEGAPTDLDLVLEQQAPDGSWNPVAASSERQADGAPASEEIVGYRPTAEGAFRLRVRRVSGPPPAGPLVLFTREIPLDDIGGSSESSVPTPADAAGAIAVGAVDWRGNRLKSYSSNGPSDDGRLKPDLVAPTDTRLRGPEGLRRVGGTSIAAPNAAGAAAVMVAAARRAGVVVSPDSVRSELSALALDLGSPGPDMAFGAGRVRVAVSPPRIARLRPAPLTPVRGRTKVAFRALSRSRIANWELSVDGAPIRARGTGNPRTVTLNTGRLPDGWHLLRAVARDWPGNVDEQTWAVRVDNTRPVLVLRRLAAAAVRAPATQAERRSARPPARRVVRAVVAASDPGTTGVLRARVIVRKRGRVVTVRGQRVRSGPRRAILVGRLARGRYRVVIELRDRAGNARAVSRSVLVR